MPGKSDGALLAAWTSSFFLRRKVLSTHQGAVKLTQNKK